MGIEEGSVKSGYRRVVVVVVDSVGVIGFLNGIDFYCISIVYIIGY